jgi:hypothetical protein
LTSSVITTEKSVPIITATEALTNTSAPGEELPLVNSGSDLNEEDQQSKKVSDIIETATTFTPEVFNAENDNHSTNSDNPNTNKKTEATILEEKLDSKQIEEDKEYLDKE